MINALFNTIEFAKVIGEYLGIVESIGAKIDKMMLSEFETGVRVLEQSARSLTEKENLLREARVCFNKAISFEKGNRLASAYLGLAIIHSQLGDKNNAMYALEQILRIQIEPNMIEKASAAGGFISAAPKLFGPFYILGIPAMFPYLKHKMAQKRFEDFQSKVAEYVQSLKDSDLE